MKIVFEAGFEVRRTASGYVVITPRLCESSLGRSIRHKNLAAYNQVSVKGQSQINDLSLQHDHSSIQRSLVFSFFASQRISTGISNARLFSSTR